jgi:hypothetical protein
VRRASVVLTVLVTVGVTVGAQRSALAYSCTPASHCYAEADWDSAPSNEGSYTYLYSSCLNGPNNTSNFADEEIWEGTDNSTLGAYWVETGLSYGAINGVAKGGPYWFWARNRPSTGNGYAAFYVGPASNSTSYLAEIAYAGNDKWSVYENTSLVGTANSNPPYSRYMATGEEVAGNYNVYGESSDMSWFDTSGGNHNTWSSGSSHPSIIETYPPADAYWSSSNYNDLTYYANCGFGAPASAHTASTRVPAVSPTTVRAETSAEKPIAVRKGTVAISSPALPTLQGLANTMAASAEGIGVSASQAVLTTRQQAATVTAGDTVNSDQGVYLVQLQGQFTAVAASMPHGQLAPTGQYLTFTVDASTGDVLDWSVGDHFSDLSTLGPVAAIPL